MIRYSVNWPGYHYATAFAWWWIPIWIAVLVAAGYVGTRVSR